MTHSTISLGVGLGGGRSATSSGRLPGGTPYENLKSVSFDGSDDAMTLPNLSYLSGASAFSLSIWFKTSGVNYLYSSLNSGINDSIQMYFHSSNELRWILGTGSAFRQEGVTSGTFNDGAWHNGVFRFDGGSNTMKIYIDGSEQTTADRFSSGSVPSATATNAGNSPAVAAYSAGGSNISAILDEIAFFSSALSASDITSIYNSGAPNDISALGPVGWWRMGDGTEAGSGTTVYDMTSNSNNGTLTTDPSTDPPTYSTDVPS